MKSSLILGFFDGIHLGHVQVIKSGVDYAKLNSAQSIVLTFKSSPAGFFSGQEEYILPRRISIECIKALGVDRVIEIDFSEIMNKTCEEYLADIAEKYSPISISTGQNHTFGKNRQGNADFLCKNQEKYGYKYLCTPSVVINKQVISSSYIKTLLSSGNIESANTLLNRCFSLEGKVIKGAQIGRTLGYPTANILYPKDIVKIPFGVYAVELLHNNKRYKGVMNWGIKPTLNNQEPIVETHILELNQDLYGQNLIFEVIGKIRDEKKFNSLDDLKQQIEKDVEVCLEL